MMGGPTGAALAPTLAIRIHEAHRAAVDAARSALVHAREAGELLIQAKDSVPHGQWSDWLASNVEFSARTAQGYMRLASKWDELSNTQRVADLSLRGALAMLAAPKEEAGPEDPFMYGRGECPAWLPAPGSMSVGVAQGVAGRRFALWVAPDARNEGMYFYALFLSKDGNPDNAHGELVGGTKAIDGDRLASFVDGLDGFPLESAEFETWSLLARDEGALGWTYNELLFGSREQYVQEWVLGRTLRNMERVIEERRDELNVMKSCLDEIREHELYRETHPTFEAYVEDRWPDAEVALAYLNDTGGL